MRTWVQNLYRWCAPVATGRRKRLVSVRRFSSQQLEAGADSQKGEGNPHYTRSHLRGPPMHSALPCMRVRKSRSSQTAQETASTCQRSTTLRPERTANKGARGEPSAGCFRSLSLFLSGRLLTTRCSTVLGNPLSRSAAALSTKHRIDYVPGNATYQQGCFAVSLEIPHTAGRRARRSNANSPGIREE